MCDNVTAWCTALRCYPQKAEIIMIFSSVTFELRRLALLFYALMCQNAECSSYPLVCDHTMQRLTLFSSDLWPLNAECNIVILGLCNQNAVGLHFGLLPEKSECRGWHCFTRVWHQNAETLFFSDVRLRKKSNIVILSLGHHYAQPYITIFWSVK